MTNMTAMLDIIKGKKTALTKKEFAKPEDFTEWKNAAERVLINFTQYEAAITSGKPEALVKKYRNRTCAELRDIFAMFPDVELHCKVDMDDPTSDFRLIGKFTHKWKYVPTAEYKAICDAVVHYEALAKIEDAHQERNAAALAEAVDKKAAIETAGKATIPSFEPDTLARFRKGLENHMWARVNDAAAVSVAKTINNNTSRAAERKARRIANAIKRAQEAAAKEAAEAAEKTAPKQETKNENPAA